MSLGKAINLVPRAAHSLLNDLSASFLRQRLPHRIELSVQASGAVATDYITKLENAHGTEFGKVLYPWHPWAGLRIGLHESVSKPDGIVFRCRLLGRRLEIPAWMFDRSVCARVRVAAHAHVDLLGAGWD